MDKAKAEQLIREQILNICKELFDSHIASILNKELIPSAMIIAEFSSCAQSMDQIKNGYYSNEIVLTWRYSNKLLEAIQMDKEPKLSANKHKNYEETYVRYAFSIEKKIVYLNIFYAPLSARGYAYHILEKEGFLKLSEAELEWIS